MAQLTEEVEFQHYQTLKQSFNIPLKIKMLLSLLEQRYKKSLTVTSKDMESKYHRLLSAFSRQSNPEKVHFLHEVIKLVRHLLDQKEHDDSSSNSSDAMEQIRQIETSCKVKESFLGLVKWEKRAFRFSRKGMKVKLCEGNKQSTFRLSHYFVRRSQKNAKALILDAITDNIDHKRSELYLQFQNQILQEQIFQNIFSCVVELTSRELISILNEKQQLEESLTTASDMSKASTILTSKALNSYFAMRDKVMGKLQNCRYKFEKAESPIPGMRFQLGYHKKIERVKIEGIIHKKMEELHKSISLFSRKKDEQLIQFECLEKFSNQISACYFKFILGGEVYELLAILEEIIKQNETVLYFKGIDSVISGQFVDFLTIKITSTNESECFLKIFGIFKNHEKDNKLTTEFLLYVLNQSQPAATQMKRMMSYEEKFWTVRQMDNVDMEDNCADFGEQLEDLELMQMSLKFTKKESITNNPNNFRRYYECQPTKESTNLFLTEHPLFIDYKVTPTGGVVCINQEQINEQKKVFKYVVSQIGSYIMARKSIVNISLPVTVFRKESHLKTIARNFAYAPMLLEKSVHQSPVDRMKQAITFQISMCILTICMTKPFNPILGETYQGLIDGCPMYLEQVSHHPPISCFYFYGRGYTIHGKIDPKVALGLNCGKGWSPAPCYITYEDGTVIEFTNSKIVLNGLLFGERTFNFEGTNYVIDHKNKLVGEIVYGKNSSALFKKSHQSHDSVSGVLCDLNGSCKGDKISIDSFKKGDTGSRLSKFEGIWNSEFIMDDNKVMDFRTDLPHCLVDHGFPIPSDGCYREDVIELINNKNMDECQAKKDFLEQIQRRDAKLRQEYKKKQ